MSVAWNELEAAFCNGLESKRACVAGADNVPIFDFEKMAVLVGERGGTELTSLLGSCSLSRAREATQRRKWG